METKNKLNYKVTSEEAYVSQFFFNVNFVVDDKEYLASCTYDNVDMMTEYLVEDENGSEVQDDDIVEIGHYLLENMEIDKDKITW